MKVPTFFLLAFLLAAPAMATEPVALGIYVSNGTYSPGLDATQDPGQLHLLNDGVPRYINELDIASKQPTTVAAGITPLTTTGSFAGLDWSGLRQVPCHPDGTFDDWRYEIDGVHWMHSTCFKGAAWMDAFTLLSVMPLDAHDRLVGVPLGGIAGLNSTFLRTDTWWERRFVARVVVHNCAAIGNCTNPEVTAYAEGLIQVRGNQNARNAVVIPAETQRLVLYAWSGAHLVELATIPVYYDPADAPYTYGLKNTLKLITPVPSRGYFNPGDVIQLQVTYTDKNGTRFFPAGTLPSYGGAVFDDPSAAGLRYLTYVDDPVLYWAHKNTQSDMTFTIAGPIDRMNVVGTTPLTIAEAGLSQIPEATPAVDGYSALVQIFPPTSLVFPCLFSAGTAPECFTPVGDTFTMTIPSDALPGTWTAQIKARRVWEGEPTQAASSVRFQVGQRRVTSYMPKMSGCARCHNSLSSIDKMEHGFIAVTSEIPECLSCHTKGYDAWFENDAGFDKRMSFVHLLSSRFFSMGGTAADVAFP